MPDVDYTLENQDYGSGPITVTMTITATNPMCGGNHALNGKPTAHGKVMWVVDHDGKQFFVVANADVAYVEVQRFVYGWHAQKKANRATIASYGPEYVKPDAPEPTVNPILPRGKQCSEINKPITQAPITDHEDYPEDTYDDGETY